MNNSAAIIIESLDRKLASMKQSQPKNYSDDGLTIEINYQLIFGLTYPDRFQLGIDSYKRDKIRELAFANYFGGPSLEFFPHLYDDKDSFIEAVEKLAIHYEFEYNPDTFFRGFNFRNEQRIFLVATLVPIPILIQRPK